MAKELVLEGGYGSRTIPIFTLNPGCVGSSSTTIDVSDSKLIVFESEVSIQINGSGETFTVPAGSRWGIGPDVTSIKLGAATKYMLG